MKYVLNPSNIFNDKVKKSNIINSKYRHYIDKNAVVFDACYSNLPYYDHVENSNLYSSSILLYGADENRNFYLTYHIVYPTFRKKVDDTRGSFSIQINKPYDLYVDNELVNEKLMRITLNEMFNYETVDNKIRIEGSIYNSSTIPSNITRFVIFNSSQKTIKIDLKIPVREIINEDNYKDEKYKVVIDSRINYKQTSTLLLKPEEEAIVYIYISCMHIDKSYKYQMYRDYESRINTKQLIKYKNYLYTGNKIIDTMYSMAKFHACETIFKTKNGYMHSPTGGQYYAAIWNNDQCEYSSPFFATLNYKIANDAMINCFNMFKKYMFKDDPLVCSVISQGDSYWNGAKDRGDASMYAYGITHFLLCSGDEMLAKKYVRAIKWCINYTLKQINEFGVVNSDSDELENRFESGNANLATNSIFYKALINAGLLFNQLGVKNDYFYKANKLLNNIYSYFYADGKVIYCKEESKLRSHIVYPLIMGINKNADLIVNTILSDKLLTPNGFKTIEDQDVYWDRVTLMAIRGLFNANKPDIAYDILLNYSKNRLLNDHVPYPVEAYPEGNQAHLSAESALYCRIFLEGILGFEPLDFKRFSIKLSMPVKLDKIIIRNVFYGGITFSIGAIYENDAYKVQIDLYPHEIIIDNFETITFNIDEFIKSKKRT